MNTRARIAAIAFTLVGVVPVPAFAIVLTVDDVFFPVDSTSNAIFPEGIAFDSSSGDLFVTTTFPDLKLTRLTTSGGFVSSSNLDPSTFIRGIDTAPTAGNLLVVDQANGRVEQIDYSGNVVGGGISFDTGIAQSVRDLEGVVLNPTTNTIFVSNDDFTTIHEFDTDGNELNTFSTLAFGTGIREPTGISYNPANGNVLFSSDFGAGPLGPGSEQIIEVTRDGNLVAITDLNSPSLLGGILAFRDAEGLSVDPANNKLYIAFEDDAAVAVMNIVPPPPMVLNQVLQFETGSPVGVSQLVDTPGAPFNLEFDYKFETLTGGLSVLLDGMLLTMISAPGSLTPGFETESIIIDDSGFFNLIAVDLEFIFDGQTGSQLLLDNIVFPGLVNGDFETGSLQGWEVDVSEGGSLGVLAIGPTSVPEPATLALIGLGLAGLGFARRRGRQA